MTQPSFQFPIARCFVVEDDPSVREALCLVLEDQGCDVAAFDSGEAFLAANGPGPDDIVLLDLGLPSLSGRMVARRMRERGDTCQIAVISGMKGADFDAAVNDIKPFAALRKPLEIKRLLDLIARVQPGTA